MLLRDEDIQKQIFKKDPRQRLEHFVNERTYTKRSMAVMMNRKKMLIDYYCRGGGIGCIKRTDQVL